MGKVHMELAGYKIFKKGSIKGSIFFGMAHLPPLLGKILCWLGIHDFRVVNVTFGFGTDGVEKDECRRCGVTRIRKA
jgi:hypothetical protein